MSGLKLGCGGCLVGGMVLVVVFVEGGMVLVVVGLVGGMVLMGWLVWVVIWL